MGKKRKKIAAAITSRSQKIISGLKRSKKVVYLANPKLHIPHTISMPTLSFYKHIEKHLQTEATIVPVTDKKITWKLFVKHNRGFKQIKIDIIRTEERNFPDIAWDRVARNIIKVVQLYHKQ